MLRLGLISTSRRSNIIYRSVVHRSTHENRARIHRSFFPLGCYSSSKVYPSNKSELCTSCFIPFTAKLFLHKNISNPRYFSSAKNNQGASKRDVQLTQKQKLKIAIRDYGAVVVVFHIGISLLSLGGFYLAVANGFDVISLLQKTGLSENVMNSKVLLEGSTFVIAYGIHKLFAPVRIAVTLSTAPFIVRYLRRIHILKSPRSK